METTNAPAPTDSRPSPTDRLSRKGPAELKDGVRRANENGRGPYKCRLCNQRHAKDAPCGSGAVARPSPLPALAAPALFTEDNSRRLVALPFRLAAIATDYEPWALDEREEKELAATGSVALNMFVSVDPKWVAATLFALSLVGIATVKAAGYAAERRAQAIAALEAENEKKRREAEAAK